MFNSSSSWCHVTKKPTTPEDTREQGDTKTQYNRQATAVHSHRPCSGSGAVQQLAEERNGLMSQKARLRWLRGSHSTRSKLKRTSIVRARGPEGPPSEVKDH